MRIPVLVYSLLLWGCGTIDDEFMKARTLEYSMVPIPGCPMRALAYTHDLTFNGYLQMFQRDARKFDVGCYRTQRVYFEEKMPGEDVLGYCVPGQRVVIRKSTWNEMSEIERKTLIYHEMGHCALNLDHTSPKTADIMTPRMIAPSTATRHWRKLVSILFTRAKLEQEQ